MSEQERDLQRRTGHTLVVEDDESAAVLIMRLLSRHGYTVSRARDGREAMRWLETHAPVW